MANDLSSEGRQSAYLRLVAKRKAHRFPNGLLNPSEIEGGKYDSEHLGPWSQWQGSLDAEVLVVGQDWGDQPYFLNHQGRDDDGEQTCKNLQEIAVAAGFTLGPPRSPNPQPLFFTNAVLGIRAANGKSGTPPTSWVDDSQPFLDELIQMIQPKAIVTLGTAALRACRVSLIGRGKDPQIPLNVPLSRIHGTSPVDLPGKPAWFPFYHCGPLGLANRSKALQVQDWSRLGAWLAEIRDVR